MDDTAAFVVVAIYYYQNERERGLKYLTNANIQNQGGLPAAFDDDDITIEDGTIPGHWILAQQIDRHGRRKTIITYPEWANDAEYFEKLDDNETDKMKASDQYGRELKKLAVYYRNSAIDGIYLAPFEK